MVIFLDRLGYIELLHQVADVVLTPAVVRELRAGTGTPGSSVPDLPWIEIRAPASEDIDEVLHGLRANTGERETVALAQSGTVTAVIDEGPARRYARQRGLSVSSTLALLVGLHQRGLATRTVEEDLTLLDVAGMYLTEELRAWTVGQVR